MAAKIAVILSGCGFLDGSEIHESVFTLLAIDKYGGEADIYAPDVEQAKVVNHITKEPMDEVRNVLVEAGRIARGKIQPLDALDVDKVDAIIMPGGFGAAINLSDLAEKGKDATAISPLKKVLTEALAMQKPIGAICIAPAILVAAVSDAISPTVTLGKDQDKLIEGLGGVQQDCLTEEFVVDEAHKIASCPAYMQPDRLTHIAKGIDQVVGQVIQWTTV